MHSAYPKRKVIDWLKVMVGDMEKNMQRLAPDGWEDSSFFAFRHPTIELEYKSYVESHERFSKIRSWNNEPLVSFETHKAEYEQEDRLPVRPWVELHELIGSCLFDMQGIKFKDPSGSVVALEHDRSTANFIASFLNMYFPLDEYDFSEGDFFHAGRTDDYIDPFPVYLIFFEHLRNEGYDMIYRIDETVEGPSVKVKAYLEVYRKKPLQKG